MSCRLQEGEKKEMNIYDTKILLVDDHRELRRMIRQILGQGGYRNVYTAASCAEGRKLFAEEEPDLVILDIMLPDGDGFSLFREFQRQREVPMLFLSARDEDGDRLLGLGLGADDYITKPFLPQELILRIGAILKRTYVPLGQSMADAGELFLEPYRVSLKQGIVFCGENTVSLTAKELALLEKLNQNRGNIVTFDTLCMAVWGDAYYGYENTLMVHIRHLREKIEKDPSHPRWLLTCRGIGYRLAKETENRRKS